MQQRIMSRRERVALSVSAAVVAFMVVYWIVQIVGVVRMLRLAYG